jgi:hypothetical protein
VKPAAQAAPLAVASRCGPAAGAQEDPSMIATLGAVRRPIVRHARARAPAAAGRASPAPCLGLALVAGAALWAALGGMVSLLVG